MAEQTLGRRVRQLRGEARREAIAEVVAEFGSSGLSAAAFCKSAGIATVTLTRWRQELDGARVPGSAPRLVEIRPTPPRGSGVFELALPTGVTLRVPSGFDDAELERLLVVLRTAC